MFETKNDIAFGGPGVRVGAQFGGPALRRVIEAVSCRKRMENERGGGGGRVQFEPCPRRKNASEGSLRPPVH